MKAMHVWLWVAILSFPATVLAQSNPDALLGVWKTSEGTGMVQIYNGSVISMPQYSRNCKAGVIAGHLDSA